MDPSNNGRILVIDDHTLFSEGIAMLIGKHFEHFQVDLFSSLRDFESSQTPVTEYSLFISDLEIPGEDMLAFIEKIKRNKVGVPVLVISMHNKLALIKKCEAEGVEGYILKDDSEFLHHAISTLLNGDRFYSPKVKETLAIGDDVHQLLTIRELDIVRLLALGFSDSEVAEKLFISLNTVRTHKRNLKAKLGFERTTQVIKYAQENQII